MNHVNYITRPSKHVERRMFVETFQCLGRIGYDLTKYHYIGFGCYYYADFILFRRLLSMQEMTCVENDEEIENRMKFNKPFKFIKLKIDHFSNYVSALRGDRNYIVWLDYEDKLNEEIITNIESVVNTLKNGSILIITVNADLKELQGVSGLSAESLEKYKDECLGKMLEKYSRGKWADYYENLHKEEITPKKFPEFFSKVIQNVIKGSFSGRLDDSFYQLFNYVYQDGTRMLTVGGIIDKKGKEKEIKKALKSLDYINSKKKPSIIKIPSLTLREKLYLDQRIHRNKKKLKYIPFELEDDEMENYIKYAKHYPNFYEVLID